MAKPIAIKLRRKKYKNFKLKINKLINWIDKRNFKSSIGTINRTMSGLQDPAMSLC